MIGFIALAGIIVRNSILLVDFIQIKGREGIPMVGIPILYYYLGDTGTPQSVPV